MRESEERGREENKNFCDKTKGWNRMNEWNKAHNILFIHRNIPRKADSECDAKEEEGEKK